jgi:hypothetical protein
LRFHDIIKIFFTPPFQYSSVLGDFKQASREYSQASGIHDNSARLAPSRKTRTTATAAGANIAATEETTAASSTAAAAEFILNY